MTKVLAQDDNATTALKNKVRGLVSAYRSRRFVRDRRDNPLRDLRIGVRHKLLDARAELSPTQYESFLQWVDTQLQSQAADYFRSSNGFDDLAGVYDAAPTVGLEREFLWIAARLIAARKRLSAFIELKTLVERATMARGYETAIEILLQVEKLFGCSMWSVQLHIALAHQAGGLEHHKNYVSEVRSVFRSGLLNFVAYHTSVRNEDKTTATKFVDDIRSRIDRHPRYAEDIKTYLKCILAQDWPHSEDAHAEIIRIAQSHSLIDVYETFIGIVQSLIRQDIVVGTRRTLTHCLEEIGSHLADPRIKKALFHLKDGENGADFPLRPTALSDRIFSTSAMSGLSNLRLEADARVDDPWSWIYSSIERASGILSPNRSLKQPADLHRLIGRVLNQGYRNEDSLGQVSKLTLNFSGLPVVAGISDFVHFLRPRDWIGALRPEHAGLNSPTLGIEDFPLRSATWHAHGDLRSRIAKGATGVAWARFHEPVDDTGPSSPAEQLLNAAGLINCRRFSQASNLLQPLLNGPLVPSAHSIAIALYGRALSHFGARQRLVDLVAQEGSRGQNSSSLLPIRSVFKGFQWEDFDGCPVPLSAPVALHLWLSAEDNEEVLSWLRFATAKFLRLSGSTVPSRLMDSTNIYPQHLLVYFLSNVCIPSILDVSRVLKGTRQVLEERQAICAALRILDPANAEDFQTEIALIANELALQEGQSIVDQSRIHVDAAALKRWATRELAEDFDRYLDLLKVDLRATKDFDEVVKDILDGTLPRSIFTPENEADALLYSMLLRIVDEFLLNPTFGFDFYLSKRVRHQSFIGLIRGPLEFSNLITTRENEGSKYRDNAIWMDRFSSFGTAAVEAINEALLRFGARFDDILLNAKNNLFHVRSTDKPAGLLSVDIGSHHVALMKTLISPQETVSGFIDTSLAVIWASLESSLSAVRNYIADDIQIRIAAYFDELKASVKRVAGSDPNLVVFNAQVGKSSAEVQRALDDTARWFSRTSLEAQMRQFSLEQVVKVGLDSALKAQRSFTPKIETKVSGEMRMRASALVFVYDVLLVALDNVRCYSGLKEPRILIRVWIEENDAALRIEVRSTAKQGTRSHNEKKMAEIRQAIANQSIGVRTRKEGLSGFIKIAAVTSQSSKGRIDFGYSSEEEFTLNVTYSLVVTAEAAQEEDKNAEYSNS